MVGKDGKNPKDDKDKDPKDKDGNMDPPKDTKVLKKPTPQKTKEKSTKPKEKKSSAPITDVHGGLSQDEWNNVPFDQLVETCESLHLPTTGAAEVLAERLFDYYQELAANDEFVHQSTVRQHPYERPAPSSVPGGLPPVSSQGSTINWQDIMRDNAAIGQQLQQQGIPATNLPGGLVSSLFSMPHAPSSSASSGPQVGLGVHGTTNTPQTGFALPIGTLNTPIVSPHQLAPQQSGLFTIPGLQSAPPMPTFHPTQQQPSSSNTNTDLSNIVNSLTASISNSIMAALSGLQGNTPQAGPSGSGASSGGASGSGSGVAGGSGLGLGVVSGAGLPSGAGVGTGLGGDQFNHSAGA